MHDAYLTIYIRHENRLRIQYFNLDKDKLIEVNEEMVARDLPTCLRDLCVLYLLKKDYMSGAIIYVEQPQLYVQELYEFGREIQKIDPENKMDINLMPVFCVESGEIFG